MSKIGTVYANALYVLVQEEDKTAEVLSELNVLAESFRQEPDFIRLLASASLPKEERCQVLDDCFRGKVHIYVLNFLKLLTEKGHIRHFFECCSAYEERYNLDNGILPVTAVTAVPLTAEQADRLTAKLSRLTGKHIALRSRIDPACLGGVRLDYDGRRLDDTVAHHLDALRSVLSGTVL